MLHKWKKRSSKTGLVSLCSTESSPGSKMPIASYMWPGIIHIMPSKALVIRRLDWWLVGQVLEVEGDWKAIGETIIKYLESEVNNLFIDMGANNLIKCLS